MRLATRVVDLAVGRRVADTLETAPDSDAVVSFVHGTQTWNSPFVDALTLGPHMIVAPALLTRPGSSWKVEPIFVRMAAALYQLLT